MVVDGDDNGDDYNQDDINAGDLTVSEGSLVPSLLGRVLTSTGGFWISACLFIPT